MLGLYELYRRLIAAFPGILFESCASGGGRFDPGMLAFAPQAWTSDDTDAIERLEIQWGTSLAYPVSSMGAHVAAVPNHQVGRVTPIVYPRGGGVLRRVRLRAGPDRAVRADERGGRRDQVAWYKERRDLLQFGRFVRLRSPFEGDGNETAWMVSAPDGSRAVAAHYRVLSRPSPSGTASGSAGWTRTPGTR